MKKVIAILIAVILIMAPLSSVLAQDADATDVVVAEEILELIWETMRAWGIQLVYNTIDELDDNIRQWLSGEIEEYLSEEIFQSFQHWITGMDWIYDNFGRRILNALGLEKIQSFVQYEKAKYNLGNNSIIHTNNDNYLNGLYTYTVPVYIDYSMGNPGWYIIYTSGTSPVYCLFVLDGTNLIPCLFSASSFRWTYTIYNQNGSVVDSYGKTENTKQYANWYSNLKPDGSWTYPPQGGRLSDNPYYAYSKSDVITALGYSTVVPGEGVDIVTGDILLPDDDPSYTEGDSIIYYPDGSIAYIDINWPESISVDNLPAVISPSGTQDPGFKNAFNPIKGFINTFSDGLELMTDIVYHFPTPIVSLALAIIGITIIFGALHMFKEH